MNVGMITCTYYMKIYGYKSPDPFNWGIMSQKWRDEFTYDDFLDLAREIHDIGFNAIEIWEHMFSWRKYSLDDAARVARDLHAIGFDDLAYCVGGLGAGDVASSKYAPLVPFPLSWVRSYDAMASILMVSLMVSLSPGRMRPVFA